MAQDTLIIEAINTSPLNRGLDGAAWLASPRNFPFVKDGDITLFEETDEHTFEVHFLYASRGLSAIRSSKIAFSWAFDRLGAELLYGLTPCDMRHARLHARFVGGKPAGVRQTPFGPCELFVMSRDMWKGSVQ